MSDLVLDMQASVGELPVFDMSVTSQQSTAENTFKTAIIVSLFTDRLADDDDVIPDDTVNRRGWWADAIADIEADKIGSRLWLLSREKQTTDVMNKAQEYAYEALEWLLEDGIASRVNVLASNPKTGWLQLDIEIDRPDESTARFSYIWEALNGV